MQHLVDHMLATFESGRLSRRDLVRDLAGLLALAGGAGAIASRQEEPPPAPFEATGLNHIALGVQDVARSRDFYRDLLGMKVASDGLPQSCFLTAGTAFLALFRNETSRMDHYCWSVKGYDVEEAAKKLKARDLKPEVHGNRIYFKDPDGLKVQLADPKHKP